MSVDYLAFRSFFGVKQVIDLVDYDANSNAIYFGYAPAGSLTTEPKWLIFKCTYDGSNRYTGSTVSPYGSIWTSRVSGVTYA